ncbi:MAG: deaminase [Patescibacteria group bacterium]
MRKPTKSVLLLYIPVLHAGYIRLLSLYQDSVEGLWIVGRSLADEHAFLEREIRALPPDLIQKAVKAIYAFGFVSVLGKRNARHLNGYKIITADEALMRRITARYWPHASITFDTSFLRWDESHVDTKTPVGYDRASIAPEDREWMHQARFESRESSDWWRHVGAVVPIDQDALSAHNIHLPTEYAPYAFGDIRDFIPAGTRSEISSAIHAEKRVIAEAARRGISLGGRSIYVTTFPCSDCARMIALSGIRRCYFGGGHASFDGATILKASGVELIYVQ